MDILVLDIGCTRTKSLIVRAGDIVERHIAKTPEDAEGILETAKCFVDKAFRDGYELQGIMPISFSESVIAETIDGEVTLYGPYMPDMPVFSRPPYELTGYPCDTFPGVCTILAYLKSIKAELFRVLPVSAMIAVALTHNTQWKMWDHMHASNTGLYGNSKWLDDSDAYKDWMDTEHTGFPFYAVGVLSHSTVPVFLGGHDSLFSIYPKSGAYISCGTYITASQPAEFMVEVRQDDAKSVRYVQDTHGKYHRQLCMKSSGKVDHNQLIKIRQFMSTDEVIVLGAYAHELSNVLVDYAFAPIVVADQQFMGAAAAAETGIYDRQSAGANAA